MDDRLIILEGDAVENLRTLETGSVQCVVTSPPYWGLRDYGTATWEGGDETCDHAAPIESGNSGNKSNSQTHPGRFVDCQCGAKRIDSQLGLEKTPEEYVAKMVEVFREVRRVLRKDGTLWLNLGDSYNAAREGGHAGGTNGVSKPENAPQRSGVNAPGLKPKDLCGIPWRVAFALQADGWWLRSDIIWAKPNPMPESVTDRPTKSHEYVFLLTKSATYFYDAEAIKERAIYFDDDRKGRAKEEHKSMPNGERNGIRPVYKDARSFDGKHTDKQSGHGRRYAGFNDRWDEAGDLALRNKRSVWTVATAPYPEAHFATYPPDLIKPCIMAGTSARGCCAQCGAPWERVVERTGSDAPTTTAERIDTYLTRKNVNAIRNRSDDGRNAGFVGGDIGSKFQTLGWQPTCKHDAGVQPCVVLDCFAGSGTTGAVALELGRKAVLIELNPKYVTLIEQRCDVTMGLALA